MFLRSSSSSRTIVITYLSIKITTKTTCHTKTTVIHIIRQSTNTCMMWNYLKGECYITFMTTDKVFPPASFCKIYLKREKQQLDIKPIFIKIKLITGIHRSYLYLSISNKVRLFLLKSTQNYKLIRIILLKEWDSVRKYFITPQISM